MQIYTLTSDHLDDEIDDFYEKLENSLDKNKEFHKTVMGDFNIIIGENVDNLNSMGRFGNGQRNETGDKMLEFAQA